MYDSNDYWESARKEAEHEQIMEGLGNIAYDEALFDICAKLDMEDCICGGHVHSEMGGKPYRNRLDDEEHKMVTVLFNHKFEVLKKAHDSERCY